MFVSFNMRFRAGAATKNEMGNCHKQWARKVAAQKAIIMKLLGLFLLLFSILHTRCFWTLFPVTISRFLAHDFRVLQLKFIYFYFFCSFWARIYEQRNIYLYIGIYMFRVGSVLRLFYSILFYFEWKVHKKNQEEVSRSFLLSLCE